jgi:hypothetical protein
MSHKKKTANKNQRTPRAEHREQNPESRTPKAEHREERTERRRPTGEDREEKTESRTPRAEHREQNPESRTPRGADREEKTERSRPTISRQVQTTGWTADSLRGYSMLQDNLRLREGNTYQGKLSSHCILALSFPINSSFSCSLTSACSY